MKQYLILLICCAALGHKVIAQEQINHPWENHLINSINEEPWRAWFVPLSDKSQVYHNAKESNWYKSLNGMWNFKWSEDFDNRPEQFYTNNFDATAWDSIQVPMSWQMAGYGTPIFVNYGFIVNKENFPKVTPLEGSGRSVGSYITNFKLPKNWDEREIYINFLGVESAFWIWVNGEKVGYSEDSRTTAEFNITPYLKDGDNKLAVEVYRLSDGVYLEDWDAWRMSGIMRDVVLLAKSKTHIRDFFIKTDLDDEYLDANLRVDIELLKIKKSKLKPTKIKLSLFDSNKKMVKVSEKILKTKVNTELSTQIDMLVEAPKLWSAEFPNLYYAVLELLDKKDKVIDQVGMHVGFREIEIRDQQLLVNGKSELILGVNRVDHDPQFGKYVSEAYQLTDIKLMKQHNINAIRTAHCPSDPFMYELCDRYGIYVIDEANVESHGFGLNTENKTANDPEWKLAHLERMEAMIQRDKNHPCVLMWSLGNEAGSGSNFYAMNDLAHKLDDTRPTHYHTLEKNDNSDILGGYNRNAMDDGNLYGMNRYLTPEQLEYMAHWEDDRPFMLNEYLHASGTSVANLKEYVALFEKYPKLIGGCIWDWVDQGIYAKNEQGETYFACGYDYPNNSNKNNCNDGLVLPDRTGHNKLKEVKGAYQRIAFQLEKTNNLSLKLSNKYLFDDLSGKYLSWSILKNGKKSKEGIIEDIKTIPGQTSQVNIPVKLENIDNDETLLIVEVKLNASLLWAEKGYSVAHDDFEISPWINPRKKTTSVSGELQIEKSGKENIVHAGVNEISFSTESGYLEHYKTNDELIIEKGPIPNLYRASTQSDGDEKIWKVKGILRDWNALGLYSLKHQLVDFKIEKYNDSVVVTTKHNYQTKKEETGFKVDLNYVIYPDGQIAIDYKVDCYGEMPENLARIGFQMNVSQNLDQLMWYGRGPQSSYVDRKVGVLPGIYTVTAGQDWTNHMKPQENSNKTDVRWMKLGNQTASGIMVSAETPFECSVVKYEPDNVIEALHPYELKEVPYNIVNIDIRNGPLSNNSCCGGKLLPLVAYQLTPGTYSNRFYLSVGQ